MLAAIVAYQIHRYAYTHDIRLIVLTILDLVVLGLLWDEDKLRRSAARSL